MKEINDIIRAYDSAMESRQRMALATVVQVIGSSYRRPGARMLITEDGNFTGAISGGCLEGDALRKALLAIHQQKNKLITYDTGNEEDEAFGVQLGCNGIVHILFECIDTENPNNPIALLKRLQCSRTGTVLVVLFSTKDRNLQTGTILLVDEGQEVLCPSAHLDLSDLQEDIRLVRDSKQSHIKRFIHEQEALIEYIAPSVSLLIVGAGNDAKPMVEAASILGWRITVIDGRATHALPQRFPRADEVILASPENLDNVPQIDQFTVTILMTHNYHYDLAILKMLIESETPYIGILGPKSKLERMLGDLAQDGIVLTDLQKDRIFGPMGLDIGAETSEEIAFSVLSEIKAVLSGRKGSSLKFLPTRIHKDIPIITGPPK